MTNGPGKSDRPTVPGKSPNNARQPAAEGMEGKGLAKGNLLEQNASRTPSRKDAPSALERVRQAAKKDKQLRFTVHGAPAPHLQPGNSARGLLLFEEGSRAGRGRGDVAALRGRTGEESPEPFRKAEARSVPSEAGA